MARPPPPPPPPPPHAGGGGGKTAAHERTTPPPPARPRPPLQAPRPRAGPRAGAGGGRADAGQTVGIRALVEPPRLLILDEPFQALDEALVARARDWLDTRLRPDQALLFVTHYADEVPRCVTRRLQL